MPGNLVEQSHRLIYRHHPTFRVGEFEAAYRFCRAVQWMKCVTF